MGASIVGPLFAFDPDLCVSSDEDFDRAITLLKTSMVIRRTGNPEVTEEWKCPGCGEQVPGAFEQCWACETMRPGLETG